MTREASPKDVLIPLLNGYYERIRAMEAEQGLWAGANDRRPRIEIFHDAVRAYSSGVSPYTEGSRLSLEWLAWDIDTLRVLQHYPLTPLKGSNPGSAGSALTTGRETRQAAAGTRRGAKSELGELYGKYAVLFVALLSEMADMNYQSRREEQDRVVEELAAVKRAMKGRNRVDLQQLAGQEVLDEEVRAALLPRLPRGQVDVAQATQLIQQVMRNADARLAGLDKLHMSFLSGQRELYQNAKPVVQGLMQEGLNVAGKFLQDTTQRGGPGAGRGF